MSEKVGGHSLRNGTTTSDGKFKANNGGWVATEVLWSTNKLYPFQQDLVQLLYIWLTGLLLHEKRERRASQESQEEHHMPPPPEANLSPSQQSNHFTLFFSTRGQFPTPNGLGSHTTQACSYLPVHRCPEGLSYPLAVPQLTYMSFATFFLWGSPLDCRVKNYQLASNGLVAPNGVKLISE
ncbi:hypothetical protein PROFUN_14749 [Planoprotostelium fungivorum]|uniref:Uncharacterized protein n=1 Tax=Planoprotostelium fungivorum TaxID=1890364 RepID=A0A2P6MXY9_9EUKA|nr:hypothetical protein PROFUN_14749 [Planoprotostelium fungivorum]